MEIELITTKRKLTKSILNQIEYLSYDKLTLDVSLEVLGYINTFPTRIILISYQNKIYKLPIRDWAFPKFESKLQENTGYKIYTDTGKIYIEFPSKQEAFDFCKVYNTIKNQALDTQIFI